MTQRAKRIMITIITIIIVIVMYGYCSWHETHYTRKAIVVNVDNNIITTIDNTKNVWQFEGKGFNLNDKVKLLMNTMHTDSDITDDIIKNIIIIN